MAAPKPINNPVYKAALATLLVYVFWWNMAGVDRDLFGMPDRLRPIAETLRLEQRWKMFSNPPRWSQWFIASGIRRDGTEVDLLTREPPDFTKPALVSATYPTQRWRKYMSNIAEANGSPHRKHFAAYLCRQANRGRARPAVASVRLTMMRQATPPQPGMSRQPPDRVVLGTWSCTDAKRVPSSPTRKASPDVPEFD